MPFEKRREDRMQGRGAGEANGEGEEVPLQARVDKEAPSRRVHARYELATKEVSRLELCAVVPVRVVHDLAEQRDSALCLKRVHL